MKTGVGLNPTIAPLAKEREREAAAMLIGRPPWSRLGYSAETLRRVTEREIGAGRAIGAFVEGRLAGWLALRDDFLIGSYISLLTSAETFRRRGIAGALVEFAEQRAFAERPNLWVCVSSFNVEAIQFYEKMGFRRQGELKELLIAGVDELLYRKTRGPALSWRP